MGIGKIIKAGLAALSSHHISKHLIFLEVGPFSNLSYIIIYQMTPIVRPHVYISFSKLFDTNRSDAFHHRAPIHLHHVMN